MDMYPVIVLCLRTLQLIAVKLALENVHTVLLFFRITSTNCIIKRLATSDGHAVDLNLIDYWITIDY